MPLFKDYSETGELLQVREEPLNEANFDRYVKVNGTLAGYGYLKGLEISINAIEYCLNHQKGDNYIPRSSYQCAKEVYQLYLKLFHFDKNLQNENGNTESRINNKVFRENLERITTNNSQNQKIASLPDKELGSNMPDTEEQSGCMDAMKDMLQMVDDSQWSPEPGSYKLNAKKICRNALAIIEERTGLRDYMKKKLPGIN